MNDFQILKKTIAYRYIVAAIYAVVLFLDRLDLTIVNIALPTLADYYHVSVTQTEWIANGFLLALAISIPISGWLGDRFGDKRVFIIATSIFGLASALCAFSPNLWTMVFCRFLQGIGGGVIIPVGMSMVYRIFDHSEFASITSFIFLPTLIAPALAPALGGFIIHISNWQWIFLFAAPICLIAVLLSFLVLDEYKIKEISSLDWVGFILASCSLTAILGFISILSKDGLTSFSFVILMVAVISTLLFLLQEANTKSPLIHIDYFKNKLFLQTNLVQMSFQICHFGSFFLIGIYLQIGVGMSAFAAGLIIGMQALGAMCTSRYSVKLFDQFGPGVPIITGFIGVAVFTTCILLINKPDMIYLAALLLFIRGIFSGLCGTPIQTASIIGFDKKDVGRASALFNAGRQVSISLGVALSSMLISYGFKSHDLSLSQVINNAPPSAFYYAFAMIPVVAMLGIIVASAIDNKNVFMKLNAHLE